MGAAKSPPASWEWPSFGDRLDHPWNARPSSADAVDSVNNTFGCMSLGHADQPRSLPPSNAVFGASSGPSSSSSILSDARASRSVSSDALRVALGATNARIFPSPVAEIDRAPSPMPLRPHPDPPRTHAPRNVGSVDNVQLAALNLSHPFAQMHSAQAPPQLASHQSTTSMNLHSYHSDSALHLAALPYGFGQNSSGTLNFSDSLADDLPLPSPRKSRLGKAKIKNELYKTEICRSYLLNNGYCKYGSKCQFAHGDGERRPVRRHPRYKTKLCRNFVTSGTCPYGTRCRFIHACDLQQDEDSSFELMLDAPQCTPVVNSTPALHHSIGTRNVTSSDASHSSVSPESASGVPSESFYAGAASTTTDVENLFPMHQKMVSGVHHLKSVGVSPSRAVSNSPIRPLNLAREKANDVIAASPNGSHSRSRLPVFRNLAEIGGLGGERIN